jgi:chromate transporter
MNPLLIYLLLLKASLTSFSGLASLPVVRHDFVSTRHLITDRHLNAAVAVGQTAPGPNGLYLVSIGYFAAGWPGACAGYAAVLTPAFLIIPILRYLGRRADRPRVKSAIQAVTFAAAGLVIHATVPLARDALTGWAPVAIAAASFLFLVLTRRDTVWVMAGSALMGLLAGLK